MNTATVSTKGQLVIPSRFRQALRLRAGDKVSFALDGDRLVIERAQVGEARLVKTRTGTRVLLAPPGAPPMTPESLKAILADLP